MPVNVPLHLILTDEALTRGLGDAEARVLIEWLVECAERLPSSSTLPEATTEIKRLCRKGRAIARFVCLWSDGDRAGACQLAASERFSWPLPDGATIDSYELMHHIVSKEQLELQGRSWSLAG